jgi:carboxylesterase type B
MLQHESSSQGEKKQQCLKHGKNSIRILVYRSEARHTPLHAARAYASILDGVPGAWRAAERQFCFDNTKRCEHGTGNTPEAQALARKMASSWATFAATGNLSLPGLTWQPTDPQSNRTMIWDNDCQMVDDPEGEARKLILS